ncbi:MAG: hypothetical protein CM1200mP40_03200 [Gammaproteobacteria bacterium]|nr:MAG: hypothetical protein CM1200mP40_03200 [Gammaproteobacteria bacterium]
MGFKPVVLFYDLNNELVDECAHLLGRLVSLLLSTLTTKPMHWKLCKHKSRLQFVNQSFVLRDNRVEQLQEAPRQFLFSIRGEENRSPFRGPTPIIIITEDHRTDLKQIALDPTDGNVAAYLHVDNFHDIIVDTLNKVVFGNRAQEMNSIAYAQLQQENHPE